MQPHCLALNRSCAGTLSLAFKIPHSHRERSDAMRSLLTQGSERVTCRPAFPFRDASDHARQHKHTQSSLQPAVTYRVPSLLPSFKPPQITDRYNRHTNTDTPSCCRASSGVVAAARRCPRRRPRPAPCSDVALAAEPCLVGSPCRRRRCPPRPRTPRPRALTRVTR